MNRIKNFFWFISILILLQACTPAQPAANSSGAYPPGKPTRQAESMIRFDVDLPGDTPSEGDIDIVIFDEVTGMMFNPERYPMRSMDGTHYTINMALPVGTVVKYRYARVGKLPAEEFTGTGEAVRYRLYRVEGQATVNDIVARWSDTTLRRRTGHLHGVISDNSSGMPLEDILITCGGMLASTRSDGSYSFDRLPVGLHNLVAYAKDGSYLPFQQGALVGDNTSTRASFNLHKPQLLNVVFTTLVPAETPEKALVRFAGNYKQLGNTFSDLPGGVSGLSKNMPAMVRMSPGIYVFSVSLPEGSDLRYKYTLGDGFWNAERDPEGKYNVRRLLVSANNLFIKDQVVTWRDSANSPLTFDYFNPLDNPASSVSVQIFVYGWSQEIPAWPMENNRWSYTLYSPIENLPGGFKQRFCVDSCASAE
jgi:hypothetical protein